MKNDVVPVQIRGILPANAGCALFVGNDEKVFVIHVEPNMGAVIGMFLKETAKERPLTHDLIQSIFKGFSINVERVVITELKNSTYFARLILEQHNEVARKIVEIVRNRIPGRFGLDPIRDVQVLCPMNRGRLGTRTLNLCRWPSTATKASRRWCGLDGPFASTTKSCR